MRVMLRDAEINQHYDDIYLLKNYTVKQTQKGKDYLDFCISDASGDLPVKMFSLPNDYQELEQGGFCRVAFNVEEFNGSKQGKAQNISLVSPQETFDRTGLIPTSSEDPRMMWQNLYDTAESFQNKELSKLVKHILTENKKALLTMPGAKGVHHAVVGGLLLHTYEMLNLAKGVVSNYPNNVNKELVFTGVILHDIGKIWEFQQGLTGLVTDYSTLGKLLGHLYMGAEYVGKVCAKLNINSEIELNVKHMILSHHGKREFGAVVLPQTTEAYLLHIIDDMDAKLYIYTSTTDNLEEGQWSERQFALDNTQVYKPNL